VRGGKERGGEMVVFGGKKWGVERRGVWNKVLERSWSGAGSDDYCESKGIFEE
jgi:hypothetical protein